jgi:hypothetical protein
MDKITPSNIELNDVEKTYNSISATGIRQYYKCSDYPTDIPGLIESHFKGVAAFNGKLIFSHTNLGLNAQYGKYIIANAIAHGDTGITNKTFDTAHKGWHHPGGEQACGSFLALGIQESADGGKPSEIQVYDTRNIQQNLPMQLIGTIKRNTGINGVAMTKEAGINGKYIIAGINGTSLTLYRSKSNCLLPDGPAIHCSAEFDEISQMHLDISGPGIALVTQKDGAIYLFALDADDAGTYNTMFLYKLDILNNTFKKLTPRDLPVPGMSGSVTDLENYIVKITKANPAVGKVLVAILKLGSPYLNSSFRWGKGLTITSEDSIEVYATDRNILPFSSLPDIGSDRDFSIVTWR